MGKYGNVRKQDSLPYVRLRARLQATIGELKIPPTLLVQDRISRRLANQAKQSLLSTARSNFTAHVSMFSIRIHTPRTSSSGVLVEPILDFQIPVSPVGTYETCKFAMLHLTLAILKLSPWNQTTYNNEEIHPTQMIVNLLE